MPRALLTATVMSHVAQFHGPAIALLQEQRHPGSSAQWGADPQKLKYD